VLTECERRLHAFCAIDAYFGYDVAGKGDPPDPPDWITRTQLRAANGPMRAFTFVTDWERRGLLAAPLPELSPDVIPLDADLVEMDDAAWCTLRPHMRAAYVRLIRPDGMRPYRLLGVAASKVLHLKRPRLFAIVDGYVARYLQCHQGDPVEKAMSVAEEVRRIGRYGRNPRALAECADYLAAHPLGEHRPHLTKVRMLDALLWMRAAPHYQRLWQALGWPAL
jgi:hypothetical protein